MKPIISKISKALVLAAVVNSSAVRMGAGCTDQSAVTCGTTIASWDWVWCTPLTVGFEGISGPLPWLTWCNYVETPGSVDNCISGTTRSQLCASPSSTVCISTLTWTGSCCGTVRSPSVKSYDVTRSLWQNATCPSGSNN